MVWGLRFRGLGFKVRLKWIYKAYGSKAFWIFWEETIRVTFMFAPASANGLGLGRLGSL